MIKLFLRDVISFVLYLFLLGRKRRGTVTLVYHSISDLDPRLDPVKINVTPGNFEEQLKAILPYQDRVQITFDDGYENNYSQAFPLLKKYGLRATFFITTDFIDRTIGPEAFGYAEPKIGPMCWDEIREMRLEGMRIGSHTRTHVNLARSDSDRLKAELLDSKRRIEEMAGYRVSDLAYPYGNKGSYNTAVKDAVKEAGYEHAYTNIMGSNEPGHSDNFALKRIRVYNDDSPFKLRMKIRGAYDWVDRIA